MSQKVKLLVVVSVVLNVLLAGVIIGHMTQMGRWAPFKDDRALATKLPPEKFKLFTEVMGGARSECKQIRKQIRETRAQTLSILTASEFDEQSFQREVDKLHELRGRVAGRVAEATVVLARQFTPEERQLLGEYLERSRPRPPPE
ncbi:MAG: periplasmic heavy metal sensor [Nitrospirota bacterium]